MNGLNIVIKVEDILAKVPESRDLDLSDKNHIDCVCEKLYESFIESHLLPDRDHENFTTIISNSTYEPAQKIREILNQSKMTINELITRLGDEYIKKTIEKYKDDCKATIYENASKVCKQLFEINKEAKWAVKEIKDIIDFFITKKQ